MPEETDLFILRNQGDATARAVLTEINRYLQERERPLFNVDRVSLSSGGQDLLGNRQYRIINANSLYPEVYVNPNIFNGHYKEKVANCHNTLSRRVAIRIARSFLTNN